LSLLPNLQQKWFLRAPRAAMKARYGWKKQFLRERLTDTFISVLTVKTVWSIVFKLAWLEHGSGRDGYGIGEGKRFPLRIIYYHIPRSDIFIQDYQGYIDEIAACSKQENSNCQEQATVAPGGELGNKSTKMQQGLTLVLENMVCSPLVAAKQCATIWMFTRFNSDGAWLSEWVDTAKWKQRVFTDSSLSNFEVTGYWSQTGERSPCQNSSRT